MKKNILSIVFLFLCAFSASSQVGIGTEVPEQSSALDITSKEKGFLIPRMTEVEMNAIDSPAQALMIYCLDCPSKGFKYFDGVNWTSLTADPAPSVTVDTELDGFTGVFVEGIALDDQTLSITVTNASFSAAALDLDTNNIEFTGGISGIEVSAVSPPTVNLPQAGASVKITYTLEGTPVGFGTLTAELNIAGILTGSTTVTVISASDFVLAQIGNEANSPVTSSVVTTEQLALITTPVLTSVVDDNEVAYQAYIDNNPTLFDSPATPVQVQAMVDAVNTSQEILARIGLDANGPDTSLLTAQHLASITPALTNVVDDNILVYRYYIDNNSSLFDSPATQAQVQAMLDAVTTPDAPTNVIATTQSDSEISVAFTPPFNVGGSPITSYTVTSSSTGDDTTHIETGSLIPIVVSGLNGGTGYTFTVTATNAVGTSDASGPSDEARTETRISDAPSIVSASAGFEQATITFTAPAHDGGAAITTYMATSSPGNIRGTVSGPGSGVITVTGLTNGTEYQFLVTAINENGPSTAAATEYVTPNVAVGDLLQGGVVYYVAPTPTDLDGDGIVDIGLICAVEDQSTATQWILGGTSQTSVNGNTLEAIGTGQTNTTAMINQEDDIDIGGAAKVAEDYSVTDNGVTYNDWFLPSLEELKEMRSKKVSIEDVTGVAFGNHYWSSSEHNSSKAKSVDMLSNGNESDTNKNTQLRVRAIRTFSGGTGLSDPGTGFD